MQYPADYDKLYRLFYIKRTQLELVSDRGYNISDEEPILNMTFEEFDDYLRASSNNPGGIRSTLSKLYNSNELIDGQPHKMLVFYGERSNSQQKQISIEIIRSFINNIQTTRNIREAILIVDAPPSSESNAALAALKSVKWQVFHESDLTYNPTKHVDTPRHELISEDEKIAKLREMKVDISKLLIIKATDPVVRYYGWAPGGLVRIHRNDSSVSILTPQSINYRIIIG